MTDHTIVMYRYTGRQGFFTIPEKWCEECDILFNMLSRIVKDYHLEQHVQFIIRPWWLWWWLPLFRHGSAHAPQLIIDGKLISAGIVPKESEIKNALGIQ